jgi:hypothetical protein
MMKYLSVAFSAALLLAPVSLTHALELRTWTNLKGQSIEAEFVRLDGDKVQLKSKDGAMFKPLKLTELSKADQDYVKEVNVAKPGFGPAPKDPKKVVSPAKEAKFDKKTAFVPVVGRNFTIPELEESLSILESDHFAIFHNKKSKGEAEELIETCERMWLDMNFFHPTFQAKFLDRRKAIILCDDDEMYGKVAEWYAKNLETSDDPKIKERGDYVRKSSKMSASMGVTFPGALAEENKVINPVVVQKSYQMNGNKPVKVKGVFTPFRIHVIAGLLFDMQAGGASDFAKAGWAALETGHSYYKEINIAGRSETRMISGSGGSEADANVSPTYDSDWAGNLKKAMRKDWKPSLEMLWNFGGPDAKPEGNATMYGWVAYLQSTPDKMTKYAELVSKIETAHQVPTQEDFAKLYGFPDAATMEKDWLDWMKSSDFK